jgi:hypothetical protein
LSPGLGVGREKKAREPSWTPHERLGEGPVDAYISLNVKPDMEVSRGCNSNRDGAGPGMSAPSDESATDVADRLYAARSALADATLPSGPRIGIAELVAFLSDPRSELSPDAQRALFASPRLRADFKSLKASLRCVELPALAAASDGTVAQRSFEGGSVRLHPSRVAGQTYALFQFRWPTATPRALLLENASGDIVKRTLPAADASGQAVLVLDGNQREDSVFLRLISDPTTIGSFILSCVLAFVFASVAGLASGLASLGSLIA